jgi:hypothetical protein
MRVHVDQHRRLPLLIIRFLILVRHGRATQPDFVGAPPMKFQIGLAPGLFLEGAILIVDVILLVDSLLSGGHATSMVLSACIGPARSGPVSAI